MSKRLLRKKKAAVSSGGEEDRLSALPLDVIRLVLSFLPSRQAVQMSMLGPCWRNLWKSLPSLRVIDDASDSSASFISDLLRYRDQTPLVECEILSDRDMEMFNDQDLEPFLRYALSWKVRVLRIEISGDYYLELSAGTLFSQHLTRLILYGVALEDFSLHVSICQSLEKLEMDSCEINRGGAIGSDFPKSLRLLRIRNSTILPKRERSFISAPGLGSLELADNTERTPWLKSLPSLVTASIRIREKYFCYRCHDMPTVACCDLDDGVLLNGLSCATNLELISHRSMIFRKEIKCYPMFSKLKTLLLSDWCMTSNFSGLVYFLQHSPILERLQLGIYSEKTKLREVFPKEQFMVSKHLKAVEITYFKKDRRVHEIVVFLAYHGVHPELINIKRKPIDDDD